MHSLISPVVCHSGSGDERGQMSHLRLNFDFQRGLFSGCHSLRVGGALKQSCQVIVNYCVESTFRRARSRRRTVMCAHHDEVVPGYIFIPLHHPQIPIGTLALVKILNNTIICSNCNSVLFTSTIVVIILSIGCNQFSQTVTLN